MANIGEEPFLLIEEDRARTRAAFRHWLDILKADEQADQGSWRLRDTNVGFGHLRSANGLQCTEFWVGRSDDVAVQINEPARPATEHSLSAIGVDTAGRRFLLRQGFLRKNRVSKELRGAEFADLTGLSAVEVRYKRGAARRQWHIVTQLDVSPEETRVETAGFVSKCWFARLSVSGAGASPQDQIGKSSPVRANVVATRPKIFASSVWGMDFEKWGAWGFTDEGTRLKLANEMGPDDFVLSIGTTGSQVLPDQRGKLLALMRIGSEFVDTSSLVEPAFYKHHVDLFGAAPWPFGFPIKSAEVFDPLPLRRDVLPRIDEENLYRVLARHLIKLDPDEVDRVLALARRDVAEIYSTPRNAFISRLRSGFTGPPPSREPRVLNPRSGPAATYVMALTGTALAHAVRPEITAGDRAIFKVGFSNNPKRRAAELNTYFPCERSLKWVPVLDQWHDDEINAWALEQEVFRQLRAAGFHEIKGEMVAVDRKSLDAAWSAALNDGVRPTSPVQIMPVGE